MGSFSIVRNAGSGEVTAVTIRENGGSVDAQNDLSNIELWLSDDNIWDTGDTELDSAQSFDSADGNCTFTDTFNVNTTTQYLFVRLDAGATATLNETIELQLLNMTTTDTLSGVPTTMTDTTGVWSKRMNITFNNTDQSEDLIDFPVLVKLTTARLTYSDFGLANGTDARFIDSNNTAELDYEIELWNNTSDSFIWTKVPQIDGSSSTDFIYMYYGNNATTDGQDVNNVWSNNYEAVWHFNQTSGSYTDSTSSSHDSSAVSVTSRTASTIGNCPSFDGSTDYITIPDDDGFDISNYTITAYVRADGSGDTASSGSGGVVLTPIIAKGRGESETSNADVQFFFGFSATPKLASDFEHNGGSGNDPVSGDTTLSNDASTWYHVATKINTSSNDFVLYVDGTEDGNLTTGNSPNLGGTMDVGIGTTHNTSGTRDGYWQGLIDEVRVSTIPRSDDWIAAQYLSIKDNFVMYPVILVSSSTSQPTNIFVNSLNNTMGSASIVKGSGTGQVTAVTLKENGGSVDAAADLDEIELWLSDDDSWDAGDNLLGTAQEFDGADGECTFTESFDVNTTTQYLIARLDVNVSASATDTIEIQVLNITTSSISIGLPCDISGTTTLQNPIITTASSISQAPCVALSTTDNIMGSFSIVRNAGSGEVTAVTIRENGGSVDAQNDWKLHLHRHIQRKHHNPVPIRKA